MPGLDRTGPLGMGPMTGRGLGLCTPWGRRFWRYGYYGFGLGRGFGRGWGRGWRWFGWGPWMYPYGYFWGPKEEEILKDEAEALREELNAIEERLRELEAKEAQT
ncbi:MAG TPA: hypothetical protein ENF54_04250 [Desulfobacteraceae bacterium]|nr:hypothetical protein [Desulfobacteraceae bacterium]